MSKDSRVKEMMKVISKLTGKEVFLSEAEETDSKVSDLPNQLNSMAQLNDRFKAKDFVPSKEIFHINRYKYEFKKAVPESINSMELLEKTASLLQLVYVCKEAKSTITFDFTVSDGLIKPGKATLEK